MVKMKYAAKVGAIRRVPIRKDFVEKFSQQRLMRQGHGERRDASSIAPLSGAMRAVSLHGPPLLRPLLADLLVLST
jgi:hypothetical protein